MISSGLHFTNLETAFLVFSHNSLMKISDSKEFVYGLIIGQTLGLAMAGLSSLKKEMPTQNDQEKIRDMIYKNVPELRKRIFG